MHYSNSCALYPWSHKPAGTNIDRSFRHCRIEWHLAQLHWYMTTADLWNHAHDDVINEMETFSASLAICAGNSPVPGEFPAQRPVTRSFDVFFDLRLNKRLIKQSRGWWFETLSRHRNDKREVLVLWRHIRRLFLHTAQICYQLVNNNCDYRFPATRYLQRSVKKYLGFV